MPASLGEITDSLAGSATPKPKKRKRSRPATDRLIGALEEILLDIAKSSDSESVRVSASKFLLERFEPLKQDYDDARIREDEGQATALAEARMLLAEFAAAKSAGLDQPGEMDQGGAPEPADPAEPADAAGSEA